MNLIELRIEKNWRLNFNAIFKTNMTFETFFSKYVKIYTESRLDEHACPFNAQHAITVFTEYSID